MEKENRPLGWTTIEEAQQLVKACLDPNTADMWISPQGKHIGDIKTKPSYQTYPCWSLGALEKLIPYDIKVNDVTFFYHSSYNGIRKWSSSYTDEDLHRLILFNSFQRRIEMLVQTVLFLLENNHIKKQE